MERLALSLAGEEMKVTRIERNTRQRQEFELEEMLRMTKKFYKNPKKRFLETGFLVTPKYLWEKNV